MTKKLWPRQEEARRERPRDTARLAIFGTVKAFRAVKPLGAVKALSLMKPLSATAALALLASTLLFVAPAGAAPPPHRPSTVATMRQAAGPAEPAGLPPKRPASCRTVSVPSPTRSPVPRHDPTLPTVGGQRLAATGLVIPKEAPRVPRLSATSWLVADLDTGDVLGACGAHNFGAPASVQKLLLAAAVLPKLDLRQKVKITAEDMAFEPGSSAVGLLLGGTYSVETLWLGLFLNSGNDAANVLARLGGGEGGARAGVSAMNAEARRLGALDTRAVTPSGLDGRGQVTSAYDLALIARACFANKDFRRLNATTNATVPPQPPRDKKGFQIQNDNQLLYQYPGALGGKVGFTDIARHTYVGAAEQDGRRLVVTLLGAEREPSPGWKQAAALLDWGFGVAGDEPVGRLVEPGELDRPTPSASAGLAGAGLTPPPTVPLPIRTLIMVAVIGVAGVFGVIGVTVQVRRVRRRLALRATHVAGMHQPVPDEPA